MIQDINAFGKLFQRMFKQLIIIYKTRLEVNKLFKFVHSIAHFIICFCFLLIVLSCFFLLFIVLMRLLIKVCPKDEKEKRLDQHGIKKYTWFEKKLQCLSSPQVIIQYAVNDIKDTKWSKLARVDFPFALTCLTVKYQLLYVPTIQSEMTRQVSYA